MKQIKTKAHYNAVGKKSMQLTTEEALKQRSQDESYEMRAFHNKIKMELIRAFVPPASSLLDLCCGRGGDIDKWAHAGIKSVTAIDISENEIKEATLRLSKQIQKNNKSFKLKLTYPSVKFSVTDQLGQNILEFDDRPFDAVTCFFAVQYFFESETSLHYLLQTVVKNLKPGGYFVGTCPDAKQIMTFVAKSHNTETNVMTIEKKWQGDPGPFGSEYRISIKKTVTDDTDLPTPHTEFLAFESVLTKAAAKYGLKPVEAIDIFGLCEPHSSTGLFRRFSPTFDDNYQEWSAVSQTNVAFAFVLY